MQAISSKFDHLDSHSESNYFRSPNTTPVHHSVLEDLPSGYWDISQPTYNQPQTFRQQHSNIYSNPETYFKPKPIEQYSQAMQFPYNTSSPRPITQMTPVAYAQSPQGYVQIPVDQTLMNILLAQSKQVPQYSPMISYVPLSASAPSMVSVPINLAIPASSSAPRAPQIKLEPVTKKALHVRKPKSQTASPLSTSPTSPGAVKRARKVRPKVQATKGSMQCQGINRKKGCQCKNAALMEYFGPRPLYCAEHIDQDPNCYYTKCKSPHQKTPGDNKGCREVVLKEFEYCHKHFQMYTSKIQGNDALSFSVERLHRVEDLLQQLEQEATHAKKSDADLYQRKNKLIPKFTEMRMMLIKRAAELGADPATLNRPADMTAPLSPSSMVSSPSDMSPNCAGVDDINAESQETYENSLSDNESLEDVFATAHDMDSPDAMEHAHHNIDMWHVDESTARDENTHFVY
jgi:hypothetical protein